MTEGGGGGTEAVVTEFRFRTVPFGPFVWGSPTRIFNLNSLEGTWTCGICSKSVLRCGSKARRPHPRVCDASHTSPWFVFQLFLFLLRVPLASSNKYYRVSVWIGAVQQLIPVTPLHAQASDAAKKDEVETRQID